jgi:hypothetical protein
VRCAGIAERIQGANVYSNAANVIPSVARVTLDLRLVPGNDAQRQVAKAVAHIKARGWHALDRDPTDVERARYPRLMRINPGKGSNAQRTPMNLPIARDVVAAVQSTVDYPVVQLPTIGGTLPLALIDEMLGGKCIIVPVVNADNNQHAENENVKVQFLWDGIETYAALMTRSSAASSNLTAHCSFHPPQNHTVLPRSRYSVGVTPTTRTNAREKTTALRYPTCGAIASSFSSLVSRSSCARCIRI